MTGQLTGFLNVHKPAGMTSHDVVARLRKILKERQIGHAGTLDPMATGVLPVAVGKACRLLRFLPADKTYLAGILLGQTTDTDDVEGKVLARCDSRVDSESVRLELAKFAGEIDQVPPIYSAIHVDGKRLHELARAGQAPAEVASRRVTIHKLEVLSIEFPQVKIRVSCSGGTYIRSIARDLGANLGTGGCLQSLVREEAAGFRLDSAVGLDELAAVHIQPAHRQLPLPQIEVGHEQARKLVMGQKIALTDRGDLLPSPCAVLFEGELLAVCDALSTSGGLELSPVVVLTSLEKLVPAKG